MTADRTTSDPASRTGPAGARPRDVVRGCGFFHVRKGLIRFQHGDWDRLSFLRLHGLPIPDA
jgi:hypothetical protein